MRKPKMVSAAPKQRQNLTILFDSVKQHPFLAIAFGIYWMQTVLLFQTPYMTMGSSPLSSIGFARGTILVAASVVTYLIWSALYKRINAISMARWFPVALSIALSFGVLLYIGPMLFVGISYEVTLVSYIVGSILIGAGTANICLETGRIFGYLGPLQVLCLGILSLLLGSIGALIVSQFSSPAGLIILVALPPCMVFCLWRSFGAAPRKTLYNHGLKIKAVLPTKFLITSAFQGLALGVMHASVISNFGNAALTVTLGYLLAVCMLFVCAITMMTNFDFLIYRVGFPLMAMGFVLYGLFPDISLFGVVFLDAGYCFQYLMSCALCAYLAKGLGQPPVWVIGTSTACLLGGQLVGGAIEVLLAPNHAVLGATIAVVLLLAALFMVSNQNIKTGWGMVRPGHDSGLGARDEADFKALAIKLITSEHGLSKREGEVFVLLLEVGSRRAISKELFLSEETIKTHISSIYNKLLVHSRQDLIDLVTQRAESLH